MKAWKPGYVDVYPQWPYPSFHARALQRKTIKEKKKAAKNLAQFSDKVILDLMYVCVCGPGGERCYCYELLL